MPKFCPDCEQLLTRETSSGAVRFQCYCGYQEEGGPADALIASETLNAGDTVAMYGRLIRNAAHDRISQQVRADCPQCKVDYMTLVRVGDNEIPVWTCKCGYISTDVETVLGDA